MKWALSTMALGSAIACGAAPVAPTLAPIASTVASASVVAPSAPSAAPAPREPRPPPGTRDTTFGDNGVTVAPLSPPGATRSEIKRLLLQPDGAIIAIGTASWPNMDPPGQIAIARYDADGHIDTSFGDRGVTLAGSKLSFFPNGAALQPDGKIVVVGSAVRTRYDWDVALVRLDRDGKLDPTFGDHGVVVKDLGSPGDMGRDVIIQRDGALVVVGGICNQGCTAKDKRPKANDVLLARFLPNGELDGPFGIGGVARVDLVPENDYATHALQMPDGKIVVAGAATHRGSKDFVFLARVNVDGTLDTTFGGGRGWSSYALGRWFSVWGLARAPDGGFFVADDNTSVLRFDARGEIDRAFAFGGCAHGSIEHGRPARVAALVVDESSPIVVGTSGGALVARWTPAGKVDETFAPRGWSAYSFREGAYDGAEAAVIDSKRRIVVGGSSWTPSKPGAPFRMYFALTRVWL